MPEIVAALRLSMIGLQPISSADDRQVDATNARAAEREVLVEPGGGHSWERPFVALDCRAGLAKIS